MIKQKDVLLLLAYAIIVNEYIHTEQLRLLNRMIGKDEVLHAEAYKKMLSDNLTAEQSRIAELTKMLHNESKISIGCFRKKLVRLMCYDGEYDESENKFVKDIFPEYEPKKIIVRWNLFCFKRRIHGTFVSRFFRFLLAKLFHKGLPYFGYSEKKMNKICMGVDEITRESIGLALELSQQYNLQDLDIDGSIDEIHNCFNIDIQELNDTEPTVALVGKTKAGKSTLLSLLCGMGNEFIGKGGQRTTKYITATHYHGIRVIDTPGLDAASEDGREDENKTMNACRMTDDILFVMSDDTYNKELKFFEQFVAANKPITVLINHKNADIFEYKWKEYREKPDLWKNHEGENRMEGWENRIKQYAKENGYEHILNDRIYHTFLLAAKYAMKKGKMLPQKWKDRKASRTEWKDICRESDYKQTVETLFSEFISNFYMFRLAQHMYISEKMLDDLKSYSHSLYIQASEWQTEYSNELQNLMDAKDDFTNNCRVMFRNKWQELYIEEIQSSDEFDTNTYKMRNKKFEQYVISAYNCFSMKMYDMLKEIVMEEYQKLHVILERYEIKIALSELMEHGIADQIDSFKTQGNRNIFRLRGLYEISSSVSNNFLPVPIGPEIMNVASEAVGSIINKKIGSWTELTRERDKIRKGEVANLFDTRCDSCYGKLEQIIQQITEKIETDPKTAGLRKDINNSCRLKQVADQLSGITEKARDALYSEYASKILQLRQKKAQYIDKKIDCDTNGSLQMDVYADRCREEVITNLKHKVVIRERGRFVKGAELQDKIQATCR